MVLKNKQAKRMKKNQNIGFIFSIIVFVLSACFDNKTNVPIPNSVTETNVNPSDIITIDCLNSSSVVTQTANNTANSGTICFDTQILPFFQTNCAFSGCHNSLSKHDGYNLSTYASITAKGIVKGNAANSKIYKAIIETGKDRMPPAPYPAITKGKRDMIAKWINEGAENTVCDSGFNKSIVVNFSTVNAIIQINCVGCHITGFASGGINLDNYTDLKKYGISGSLYGSITSMNGYKKMPTDRQLSTCDISIIKKWIDLGMPNN